MDGKLIKELLQQGWLRVKTIQEVAGFPKEHIEQTMDALCKKVDSQKDVKLIDRKIAPPEKVGEKMWSMFADSELMIEGIDSLMGLIFDYMPSSVEIIEPESFDCDTAEITGLLNDMIAKLHGYDGALKQSTAMLVVLQKKLKELGVDDPWKEFREIKEEKKQEK